jgi:hypothetical protein
MALAQVSFVHVFLHASLTRRNITWAHAVARCSARYGGMQTDRAVWKCLHVSHKGHACNRLHPAWYKGTERARLNAANIVR